MTEHDASDDLEQLDSTPAPPTSGDDEPAPDEIFDAQVAAAMMADAAHEEMKLHMQRLGERLGSLHMGMVCEGMDPETAGELTHAWMLNAVFQATARETGTLGM
ncbi:MAG: hypothetical protein E6R04_10410 [Spirochaetes bacterium]|nr:MAG: hypothetical protein E6R04_10410 [Spirochaetota bacterium]